jgi:hypothetical protein
MGKECITPARDDICRKKLTGTLHGRGNEQKRIKRRKNMLKMDFYEAGCEALYRADLSQARIS